jgi:hypothetical protein
LIREHKELSWNLRDYPALAPRSGTLAQRQERSMNTFMLLTFVLVFLFGIVTGAWLNAITVRSR